MDIPVWALWSLAAAVLLAGELLTPGLFFLGPLAVAAMAAMLAAVLIGSVGAVVVFICGCAVSLLVLRPLARRHLRLPTPSRTGTAALVGTAAVVLQHVDRTGGRVKIRGEVWSARAYLHDQEMEPGEAVEVVEIDGATALVL
jgi:membrane protein implicated in regulation of membrane protease activity